jgi:uncharacterized protein (TIGR02996 family)
MSPMPSNPELLKAVSLACEKDTPRLAYADWLEGLDTTRIQCPTCEESGELPWHKLGHFVRPTPMKCVACAGRGSVVDDRPTVYAELIRLSIEFARLPAPPGDHPPTAHRDRKVEVPGLRGSPHQEPVPLARPT